MLPVGVTTRFCGPMGSGSNPGGAGSVWTAILVQPPGSPPVSILTCAVNDVAGGRCSNTAVPTAGSRVGGNRLYSPPPPPLSETVTELVCGWRSQVTVTVLCVALAVTLAGGCTIAYRTISLQVRAAGVDISSTSRSAATEISCTPLSGVSQGKPGLPARQFKAYCHVELSTARYRTRYASCHSASPSISPGARPTPGTRSHHVRTKPSYDMIETRSGAGSGSARSTWTLRVLVCGSAYESVALALKVLAPLLSVLPSRSTGSGPQLTRSGPESGSICSPSMLSVYGGPCRR